LLLLNLLWGSISGPTVGPTVCCRKILWLRQSLNPSY
jgi:hypothetical protein